MQRELAAVLLRWEGAPDTWGAGGQIVRYAGLVKLAKGTADA